MYNYYYKKNKIEQLQGFCAVVACGNTVEAAKKLCISKSSISLQISSLERDLGFELFDKIKNKLVLNTKGKVYYQEAKRVLVDLDKIYNGKIEVKIENKFKILKNHFKVKLKDKSRVLKRKANKKLSFKIKWVYYMLAILSMILYIYMQNINYLFDKNLKKLASPLLREIIENGHYRIDKNNTCPIEPAQMHPEMAELSLKLMKEYDIKVAYIGFYQLPDVISCVNGEDEVDNAFNNPILMPCKTKERFALMKKESTLMRELLVTNNAKYYILHIKTECTNINIFHQNLEKYNGKLIGIKVDDSKVPLKYGSFWILHHNDYYYLMLETNGRQTGVNLDQDSERYLIFKKLTLSELMTFDNGSYWKLIKEYGIKI